MVTIQRVRVRWNAAERGAADANARRGLDQPVALPSLLPAADVVIHEVLADSALGYARSDQVLAGGLEQARAIGLWLSRRGETLTVERLPGSASYPRPRPSGCSLSNRGKWADTGRTFDSPAARATQAGGTKTG
jgi:hypothetical protein